MDLHPGELIGILGPNGSGKTTFLKCLNHIHHPRQGRIFLYGKDIIEKTRKDVAKCIGFVPQANHSEMTSPSVYDVVMMGRKPYMTWQFSQDDDRKVWEVLKELDIANLASHHFDELSSGQAQRVLIARALAQDADILLLDEPTSNLDVKYQMDVMNIIRNLVNEKKVGACVIVHDLDLAMKFCDRVVLLNNAHIVSYGTPIEALTPDTIFEVYGVKTQVMNIAGRDRVLIE